MRVARATGGTVTQPRERTFDTADGPRVALVREPANGLPTGPRPLVVLLHGAGGTARLALGNTQWPELADREGLLLAAPEGTRRDPQRPPAFRQNPQAWNDGSGRGHTARHGTDDVGFLAMLIERLTADDAADPARVFIAGFSNGGSMAFRLAAEQPDLVAAIGPVAGHCWVTPATGPRAVPALMLFGGRDPLNPVEGGDVTTPWGTAEYHPPVRQSFDRWRHFGGCGDSVVERARGPGVREWSAGRCRAGVEVRLCIVEELGHHWPGAPRLLPPWIAGPASGRLHGASALWEFFRRW